MTSKPILPYLLLRVCIQDLDAPCNTNQYLKAKGFPSSSSLLLGLCRASIFCKHILESLKLHTNKETQKNLSFSFQECNRQALFLSTRTCLGDWKFYGSYVHKNWVMWLHGAGAQCLWGHPYNCT